MLSSFEEYASIFFFCFLNFYLTFRFTIFLLFNYGVVGSSVFVLSSLICNFSIGICGKVSSRKSLYVWEVSFYNGRILVSRYWIVGLSIIDSFRFLVLSMDAKYNYCLKLFFLKKQNDPVTNMKKIRKNIITTGQKKAPSDISGVVSYSSL